MLPDFLCIGAPKAGTAWLYVNVKHHPDVWMPPRKEIHYFDDILPLPLILPVCNPKTWRQRAKIIQRLLKPTNPIDAQTRHWHLRFLLLPRTDTWYASMFSPGKGQITGDITPTYASIKQSRVARVKALMPNVKLIYQLRNPIHRTWSQTAMHFNHWWGKRLHTITDKQIKRYLNRKSYSRDSDYMNNLRTWVKFFPPHQFHVAFFDQLVQNPRGFLKDVYHFLDLDASEQFIPQAVPKKRNVGRYPDTPDHFARYLARQYYKQIEQLHQRFDNRHTAKWLEFARQYV